MQLDTHLTPHSFKAMAAGAFLTALVGALAWWGADSRKLFELAKCDPKGRSTIIVEMTIGGTYSCVAPERMRQIKQRAKKKKKKRV